MFKLLYYRKLLNRKTVISEIAPLNVNVMKSPMVIVSYCLGAAKWSKPKVGTTPPSFVNYIALYEATKKCSA